MSKKSYRRNKKMVTISFYKLDYVRNTYFTIRNTLYDFPKVKSQLCVQATKVWWQWNDIMIKNMHFGVCFIN